MATIHLLPEGGRFYKANLHCHSNLSDGCLSPAQLRDAYKARGYQVLCITDHELLIDHSDLSDENFLMLTGYEISVDDVKGERGPTERAQQKCCHMNFYSPRADYTKYVCYNPGYYDAHMRESLCAEDLPAEIYTREYSPEGVSEMVRMAHEAGFLCSYNHPGWSLETCAEYGGYKGFDMMEVVNFACVNAGLDEVNIRVYDEMLRTGQRLAASAADDDHNGAPLDSQYCDSFGGWVMIKAPSLAYEDIWQALRRKDFYACAGGPAIHSLTVEDGTVHLVCDGAREIHMVAAGRRYAQCRRGKDGQLLTEASFALDGREIYVRFETVGADGRCSYTRAYFLDEMQG